MSGQVQAWVDHWSPIVLEVALAMALLALTLRPVITAIAPRAMTSESWRRVLRIIAALETVAQTLGIGVPPRKRQPRGGLLRDPDWYREPQPEAKHGGSE